MNKANEIQGLIDELEEIRVNWRKPWSIKMKTRIYFVLVRVIKALYDYKLLLNSK